MVLKSRLENHSLIPSLFFIFHVFPYVLQQCSILPNVPHTCFTPGPFPLFFRDFPRCFPHFWGVPHPSPSQPIWVNCSDSAWLYWNPSKGNHPQTAQWFSQITWSIRISMDCFKWTFTPENPNYFMGNLWDSMVSGEDFPNWWPNHWAYAEFGKAKSRWCPPPQLHMDYNPIN